jgi:hypothetical protein
VIVCPQCRESNEEGANFCSKCGRTLEPGPAALAPRRELVRGPSQLELPPAKPRSRWPVLGFLGVILVFAGGYWLYTAVRPDPCEGRNFVSERFGYCLSVPEGWEAGPGQVGVIAFDEIVLPSEAAVVTIRAVDLATNEDLTDYAESVRAANAATGLDAGPVSDLFLDSETAVAWDVTGTNDRGQEFSGRQVITLVEDTAWIISFSDRADRISLHQKPFQAMLASFRFR